MIDQACNEATFASPYAPAMLDDSDLENVAGGATPGALIAVGALSAVAAAGIAFGNEVGKFIRNHTAPEPLIITD